LNIEPLVKVQIIIAEFSRAMSRDFGFKWSNGFSAQLLPTLSQSGNLSVSLDALEKNGSTKILASPTSLSLRKRGFIPGRR